MASVKKAPRENYHVQEAALARYNAKRLEVWKIIRALDAECIAMRKARRDEHNQ